MVWDELTNQRQNQLVSLIPTMKYQRIIKIGLHVCVWGLLLLTPILFPPAFEGNPNLDAFISVRWLALTVFGPIIAFFYFNRYVLIPKLWQAHNHWYYLVGVLVSGGITMLLISVIRGYVFPEVIVSPPKERMLFMRAFGFSILFVSVWASSSGLWLLAEREHVRKRLQASENQRIKAELAQLKGQLNPHFLFNTLNGIYGLALSRDGRTPEAILKLSRLLDYVLSDLQQETVSLKREVDHLIHFVELNRLRISEKTSIDLDMSGDFSAKYIAPMLLLPFVENAFKYGVSNSTSSSIKIKLSVQSATLNFRCVNQTFPRQISPEGHGVGIENTKRRLALVYPEAHSLRLIQEEGQYVVALTLQLDKGALPSNKKSMGKEELFRFNNHNITMP
jgi:sensor histidine kinase YesM